MNLWFVFALMTVAAVFAVLWPLGRRYGSQTGGTEATVYRDQLAEVDRDLAGGLIGASIYGREMGPMAGKWVDVSKVEADYRGLPPPGWMS